MIEAIKSRIIDAAMLVAGFLFLLMVYFCDDKRNEDGTLKDEDESEE